jgi:hypothetical protein
MTSCENCGAHVTDNFARVFGDKDGTVHACMECEGATAVKRGAAAKPDRDPLLGL